MRTRIIDVVFTTLLRTSGRIMCILHTRDGVWVVESRVIDRSISELHQGRMESCTHNNDNNIEIAVEVVRPAAVVRVYGSKCRPQEMSGERVEAETSRDTLRRSKCAAYFA